MAIGIVRALVGTTTATDSRGNTRVLRVGDAVELNETIQSSAGSTVLIQFDNGGFATVGSNDKLVLDQSVLDPTGNTRTAEAAGQSVEDIQAMIAAGMDPTQIAEATAAGADAGTAGDPGHWLHQQRSLLRRQQLRRTDRRSCPKSRYRHGRGQRAGNPRTGGRSFPRCRRSGHDVRLCL